MSTQTGWRLCSKCGGLVWFGNAACPSGGVHDHSSSSDYTLHGSGGESQGNWSWCSKCQTLGYTGTDGKIAAPCAAGGLHDHSGSTNYGLDMSENSDAGQGNWRWCRKCQGLFWAGSSSEGSCQAGGAHDGTGSGNYVLSMNGDPAVKDGQSDWRWCSKCMMLAFNGLTTCAGGGSHVHAGGDAYVVNSTSTSSTSQTGWGVCGQCYSLFYAGVGDSSGVCPGHAEHVRLHGLDFALEQNASAQPGLQDKWAWCSQCQMLWRTGDSSNICPQTNASHASGSSADYALELDRTADTTASTNTSNNTPTSTSPATSSSPAASTAPPSVGAGSSLSSGAIAGIAVGAVAGCLVLGGALAYLYWKKRKQGSEDKQRGITAGSPEETYAQIPKTGPRVVERPELDGRMLVAELDTAPVAAEVK